MTEKSEGQILDAEEVAAAVEGRLTFFPAGARQTSRQVSFSGVTSDSRGDCRGKLFIALKGDRFDAHDFILNALNKGATGLLMHRPPNAEELEVLSRRAPSDPAAVIEVADTLEGLHALARHWRRGSSGMFLGITGTNGKTSTKEFAASIIGACRKVSWSKSSYNNHWGVPFTVLESALDAEVVIVEMGMNHIGELRKLSSIVEADVVVCTMVGRGHLEGVGSIDGVARAKSEIYECAPSRATFLFNLSNSYTCGMLGQFYSEARRVITFAEATAMGGRFGDGSGDISLAVVAQTAKSLTISGWIRGELGTCEVPVFGAHHVNNLMAAAALALAAGLSPTEIWRALPLCKTIWGRGQWYDLRSGGQILFDGYNANPESMKAALDGFHAVTGGEGRRRFAVLGEMLELGNHASSAHEELGRQLARIQLDGLIFIGASGADVRRGLEADLEALPLPEKLIITDSYNSDLATGWATMLRVGDSLLVKGSRGIHLEEFVGQLAPVGWQNK